MEAVDHCCLSPHTCTSCPPTSPPPPHPPTRSESYLILKATAVRAFLVSYFLGMVVHLTLFVTFVPSTYFVHQLTVSDFILRSSVLPLAVVCCLDIPPPGIVFRRLRGTHQNPGFSLRLCVSLPPPFPSVPLFHLSPSFPSLLPSSPHNSSCAGLVYINRSKQL